MSSGHAVGEARAVVRCQACHLNQFLTNTGECRRCKGKNIGNYHLVIPITTDAATLTSTMQSFRKSLGTFIRAVRMERRLTQAQLAVCLHTHRTFISRIESGRCSPPLAMFARASFLMGLDKAIVILRRREPGKESPAARSFGLEGTDGAKRASLQ